MWTSVKKANYCHPLNACTLNLNRILILFFWKLYYELFSKLTLSSLKFVYKYFETYLKKKYLRMMLLFLFLRKCHKCSKGASFCKIPPHLHKNAPINSESFERFLRHPIKTLHWTRGTLQLTLVKGTWFLWLLWLLDVRGRGRFLSKWTNINKTAHIRLAGNATVLTYELTWLLLDYFHNFSILCRLYFLKYPFELYFGNPLSSRYTDKIVSGICKTVLSDLSILAMKLAMSGKKNGYFLHKVENAKIF